MLAKFIDTDAEPHFTVTERDSGRRLLFLSRDAFRRRPIAPHWAMEVGSERALAALERWFAARRDRWAAWGELAERVGSASFRDHMSTLLEAEPPVDVVATTVTRLPDPREIALAETLAGVTGEGSGIVHVHRFASPELRERLFDWLDAGENARMASTLVSIGRNAGADELGATLDALAERPDDPAAQAPPRQSDSDD